MAEVGEKNHKIGEINYRPGRKKTQYLVSFALLTTRYSGSRESFERT